MLGLYIHIPFCKQKCPYCNFYSSPANTQKVQAYFEALHTHLSQWAKDEDRVVNTIYFGGGTPGLFPEKIAQTVAHIRSCFDVAEECEISIEANPGAIDKSGLCAVRQAGVNRLSFGVQSASEKDLAALGRIHTVAQAKESIAMAKAAGFDNISVDFMLATPGQDMGAVEDMRAFLREADPTHVSAYMLKVEPDTPFGKMGDKLVLPDEDTVADLYEATCEMLAELGYAQYEVSNFAKDGYTCRHNLKYWDFEDYLGVGPGAHSMYKGKRFYYPSDTDAFIAGGIDAVVFDGVPDTDEYIMLQLRKSEGLDTALLADGEEVLQRAQKFNKYGLCTIDGTRVALTVKGFLVSNMVIAQLLYG